MTEQWITEVEKEVDEIRDMLQKRAEKIGWDVYWKEGWKRSQKGFQDLGLGIVRDKTTGSYVVGPLTE